MAARHRAPRTSARERQAASTSSTRTRRSAATSITVRDARAGDFDGTEIPRDLQRQWIQGTGPAARPSDDARASSIRNVAYALLSGADGWMFDGEDALGQVSTMSLDNQRNLKLPIQRDPRVPERRRAGRRRDERVGAGFLRPADRRRLAEAARLHDEDLPRRAACTSTIATCAMPTAAGFSASIVDVALYVVNNHAAAAQARARRSCCTCRRFRPPKKRRCGTTSSSALEAAPRPAGAARSRSTCSSSRSRRASS